MKVKLEIELVYDMDVMHHNDEEGRAWFYGKILNGMKGKLTLYSYEIDDEIGQVNVIRTLPDTISVDEYYKE